MSLDLAKKLIEFARTMGVRTVLLIGGEPTYHLHLIEVLELLKE